MKTLQAFFLLMATIGGPLVSAQQAAPATRSTSAPAAVIPGLPAPAVQPAAPMPMPDGAGAKAPTLSVDLVTDLLDRTSPLTVDEIKRLRSAIAERERAWNENIDSRPPPRARVVEHRQDLSPGITPPIVRVAIGQGALVTFVGADGQPWRVTAAENFNPVGIKVSGLAPHVLSVSLRGPSASGSVGVMLDGVPTGVTFNVVPAQTETDHRVEMVVPLSRQAATTNGGEALSIPSLNTAELSAFLQRVPPTQARELAAQGASVPVLAWQMGQDRLIVRTTSLVVSPGIYRRHSSSDGTHVFELPLTPVVMLAGPKGGYENVTLSGMNYPSRKAP